MNEHLSTVDDVVSKRIFVFLSLCFDDSVSVETNVFSHRKKDENKVFRRRSIVSAHKPENTDEFRAPNLLNRCRRVDRRRMSIHREFLFLGQT